MASEVPRCACGQIACRVVSDWRGGWIMLCGPHWQFWRDERIRVELPVARLEIAESMADDIEDAPAREAQDWGYFWRNRADR